MLHFSDRELAAGGEDSIVGDARGLAVLWLLALLVFVSGACALIYQAVWLRQFRLIFGASTAASAAVIAIFMGGLGLGSALLGKRADRSPNPLRMYGWLELGIGAERPFSRSF